MEHLEKAITISTQAVEADRAGNRVAAASLYWEAATRVESACRQIAVEEEKQHWLSKVKEYRNRADALVQICLEQCQDQDEKNSLRETFDVQRSRFLMSLALDADESGEIELAINLYTQAVECSLAARKYITNDDILQKLTMLAKQALERAEDLKGVKNTHSSVHKSDNKNPLPSPTANKDHVPVCSSGSSTRPNLIRGSSAHLKVSGEDTYSADEKRVLLATSNINNIDYVPFMNIDLSEKFQYPIPFSDKNGPLALSTRQMRYFSRWARPEEFCSEPKMVQGTHVDCFSIKQTIVSDCSFVASLAVSAMYEKRFGKRLVTSIIYPRNRNKEPIYNPFGKYMVKLHLNGVPRKVIIDDQLPLGRHGELLCSYSTNKNELWISLLEKAYMKVMGGYDFPGSNSSIDLHALTGWIPERVALQSGEPDFNADALFSNLMNRLAKGDVLITVATGSLPETEADRTGLAGRHAYAVLDIRLVQGIRLMKIKNPWSHMRWRGNYSELDMVHWTEEMKSALNFDPKSAAMFDNGVFWIDYDSILRFYDVFYLNWNPALFTYTYCIHQSWSAGVGPVKDNYNISENPQYRLEVEASKGAVWILLTRHITQIDDFRENTEYITVLVYKNDGNRVYYPNDPPPYINGARINSPHYLCKIILNDTSTTRKFTLVVSQYEKMHTINYTLRAYATCPISLSKIKNPYIYSEQVTNGQWKGVTAGGCRNNMATYMSNPRYRITLESTDAENQLAIDLKGPKQYNIGIEVTLVSLADDSITAPFKTKSSGAFRPGFVILELRDVPVGVYEVVPSTFHPDQEGPFFLNIRSSCRFKLDRVN